MENGGWLILVLQNIDFQFILKILRKEFLRGRNFSVLIEAFERTGMAGSTSLLN